MIYNRILILRPWPRKDGYESLFCIKTVWHLVI